MKPSHHLLVRVHCAEYSTANFFRRFDKMLIGKVGVARRCPVSLVTEQLADEGAVEEPGFAAS